MNTPTNTLPKVSFFGPLATTFSSEAYEKICIPHFGAPRVEEEGPDANFVPTISNETTLRLVESHGGFGLIPMETLAQRRIHLSALSFLDLLERYKTTKECPLTILSAAQMPVSFALMTNPNRGRDIQMVVGHQQALTACAEVIKKDDYRTQAIENGNGEAARLIACNPAYINCAALAPLSAATKFGLVVKQEHCEDSLALTTFYMVGPKSHIIPDLKHRGVRLLVVFRFKNDEVGLIHKSTGHFARHGINQIQIHSEGEPDGYRFLYELEAEPEQIPKLMEAMEEFKKCSITDHIIFGPFPMLKYQV